MLFNDGYKQQPSVIYTGSMESVGGPITAMNGALNATAAFPTANLALYVPFIISRPFIAMKLFWMNGSTVGSNNVDVGIFTHNGAKIVSSGSTATSGASATQVVDITDTTIGPGLYYFGMSVDGTTDTFICTTLGAPMPRSWGVYEETSAFTLPTTATFAGSTRSFTPVIGMTNRTQI